MKILWLSHLLPFPSQGGGVLQRSANLLKTISSTHDVTLIAFNQKNILRMFNDDINVSLAAAMKEMKNICKAVEVVDIRSDIQRAGKYRLALRSLFSRTPYSIRWLISEQYERLVKKYLAAGEFDVVWFDTISLSQFKQEPAMTRSLTIMNHHNIESDMMFRRASKEKNYIKKLYYLLEAYKLQKYEKNEVCKYDLNITCSDLDSRRLETICPGVCTYVIPNGVDTDFFSQDKNISPDPYSLVFIGGMSWYPNRDAMLFFAREVWPRLKQKFPDIKMHVIGESPPQELVDLASKDSNYHVYGFVDDVKKYFNEAAIYVCPISDGGGTKLKILDALAMGKPIVAHQIACEGIDVADRENVLFAEKPMEYVSKIEELINDSSLQSQMSENNRNLIHDRYSYEVIGKELLNLIETNSRIKKSANAGS